MESTYETDRLYIKILSPNNSLEVLEFLYNNKNVFEPFESKKPKDYYTDSYQKNMLLAEADAFSKLKYIRYYAIKKEDNTIIGTVSFSNIIPKPFCSCSIGYKIDKAHQRLGYATELITCATKAMFSDFGIHRIEAYVLTSNIPSICLLESLNFTNEGISSKCIEVAGKYKDHYRYSIISPYSL